MKRPEIFVVLQRMFLPGNPSLDRLAERVDAYADSIAAARSDKDDDEAARVVRSIIQKMGRT